MAGEEVRIGEAVLPFSTDLTEFNKGLLKAKAGLSGFLESSKGGIEVFKGLFATEALRAVSEFVRESIKEYIKLDQALDRTSKSVARLGYSYKDARKLVEEYSDSVETLTQFSDTEAADSLNGLIRITQDLTVSLNLSSLAMDVAVSTGQSLGDTSNMLALAYQGNERGLMMLARQMGITGEKAKDSKFIFEELDKRYAGAALTTQNLYSEIRKLGAELGNVGEVLGREVSPALMNAIHLMTDFLRVILGRGDLVQAQRDIETYTEKLKTLKRTLSDINSGKLDFVNKFLLSKDKTEKSIDEYTQKLAAAKAAYAAAGGQLPGGGKLNPHASLKDQAAQDKAEQDHNRERARVLDQEIQQRNDLVDRMVQQRKEAEAFAATLTGPVASGMQSFFTGMIEGTKKLSEVFEALGKSIVKAILGAMATVMEQKAAQALVEAGLSNLNPLTALASPGFLAQAAGYATAAGGLRAVAASLAEGGIVTPTAGGRIVQVAEAGEAEAVIPLSKLSKMMGGGGIGQVHINLPNVKDGRDFQKPSTMRTAANMLLRETQRMKTRSGNAFSGI